MKQALRVYLCITLFFFTVILSILAIIVTNKTLPISKEIQLVNRDIATYKEDNQDLLLQISELTSHQNLLKKAEYYSMKPVSVDQFIHVKVKQ